MEKQRLLRAAFQRRDLDALADVHRRILQAVSMLESDDAAEVHRAVPCGSVGACRWPYLAKVKKLERRSADEVDQALRESRGDLADWGLWY